MSRIFSFLLAFMTYFAVQAQVDPDVVYMPSIKGVKLFQLNNQTSYAITNVNSAETLELHFDDLDARVKSYFYTFELCNSDWRPANLSTFDYLKGFSQVRMNQYRVSSIAFTRYIHYQANIPDRNSIPTKSGNYLLKVFLDGDVNKLAFTRRILVVDQKADIAAQILQPFNSQLFRTHQKVQFSVSKAQLNSLNPNQDIKVVILQNNRWDNAVLNLRPTFIRQNMLEFNAENDAVFPAGKEFRWADMRSFRLKGERIAKLVTNDRSLDIFLQPDPERSQQRYVNFRDYNGYYIVENTDTGNPWWQGDYASVHFTFVPNDHTPYPDKNVYLVGELNSFNTNDTSAMKYNAELGYYEKTVMLKQGFYSYTYVTRDIRNKNSVALAEQTDGNFNETENDYTILVYYRPLAGRHDELIGITTVNSLNSRRIGF
ncbi:DUF5103 domain-containing protein [Segetibacter sp. 3557_3]|uniref:type IX secretion system plug protein n=1 Tax=Segetibacter sp. 3557_3 TaxID=2547429 RepID=UPI001058F307|nr:DUF5103 domain-containing protein [Segetibacter sp. 3557_3]TDH29235.1 DUF5103 domain-containing protein [Segetibacter sp. 3557_3]